MEKFGLLSCFLLMLHTSTSTVPGSVREFIHVETPLSWYDARTYCQTHFQELFRVSDQNHLKNLTRSENQLSWTGLYRANQLWKWVDKSVSTYFNWYKLENCASMTGDGFWYDRSCNDALNSLCGRNGYFWRVSAKYIWDTANQYCTYYYHQSFAIIHDATENTYITGVIGGNTVWIGLKKGVDNIWRWVDNNPLTYSNWYTPYFCAVMDWNGFWRDRYCFEENPFVCFGTNNNILEYRLVNEDKTWKEAQSHCEMLSMKLVMVKTQAEITALLGQITGSSVNNRHFWIGLYNDPWYWSEGTSEIRNWNSMQPDGKDFNSDTIPNNIQSCVASKNGEWFDEDCTKPRYFFCSAMVRSTILVSEPKSWEEALDHCRDRYVDLVSVGSEAEQQTAARKIKDVQTGYVWTGLRFLAGSWFWVYGDDLQYQNWLGGAQPQCPVQHHCGALNVTTGKWEPRSCEERLNFLCFQQ